MARGGGLGQSVAIDGLPQLIRACRAAEGALDDMKAANARAATIVADAARARAPRRSGRLAASVKGNTAARTATISTPRIRYSMPVHWGWRTSRGVGVPANPFITEAAASSESRWLGAYTDDLEKIVDQIGGSTR